MNVDPALASALVITVGSIIVAVVTVRNNRTSQQSTEDIESRRLTLDEFAEIAERNEAAIARSDARAAKAEERLDLVEKRLDDEVRARREAVGKARQATRRVEQLERRVKQLEDVLATHDIPVPPEGAGG